MPVVSVDAWAEVHVYKQCVSVGSWLKPWGHWSWGWFERDT